MTNTALIIIDLQNAFCAPGGALDRRGERIIGLEDVIHSVTVLVDLAHQRGWPVIFTRLVLGLEVASSSALFRRLQAEGARHRDYAPGGWNTQLVEIATRLPEDRVIQKSSYDPFCDTDLERLLLDLNITRLVVGGVLTNVCVESCVRSAFERGFRVSVIENATASYSEEAKAASLATIQRGFGQVVGLDRAATIETGDSPST